MRKIFILTIIAIFMVSTLSAATVIFTCNVGGATVTYQDDDSNTWKTSSFPLVLVVKRYTYISTKVTVAGYEPYEKGFEVTNPTMNNILIELLPENLTPTSAPIFGACGSLISKRKIEILPNTYKVLGRNLKTFKKTDAAQVSQDVSYNEAKGGFSVVFANFATNRAAAVGDQIFIGAFNSSLTRCYAQKTITLTEEIMEEGGMVVYLLVP